MSARDHILGSIRRVTDGAGESAKPAPLRPAVGSTDDALAAFVERAEANSATVSRLNRLADLPDAVASELRRRNLPAAIRTGTDPAFDRDWGMVERTTGPGRSEEPATLTRAELGIAEIGALVFTSGPENPMTLNFLGETHFAVVAASDIRPGYEDVCAALRERSGRPRTTTIVAGPSRSADIGQTLQLGAHGPVALHIFVIDDMGR